MNVLDWISLLTVLSIFVGLVSTFRITTSTKSAYLILLTLSLLAYLVSKLTYIIEPGSEIIKWSNLLTLCFILSALFGLIRRSKPVFARFPIYLIYLPFIIPFFYPLIIDQNVLTNLLLGTLEAGCIIVSLMIYGIHQIRSGDSIWELIGSISFSISFIIFWFIEVESLTESIFTEILIVIGILFVTTGIHKRNKLLSNVTSPS
jgi:hypothetical protein